MRVLIVTQYFHPEVGATQTRMREFARALATAGHGVDVLTEFPNHPTGIIPERYRGRWIEFERLDGFRVIRVRVLTSARKNFRTRVLFYGSFGAMALACSIRLQRRYDIVAATSPPLPVAVAGRILSWWKRAAFVMDVRDLWPLAAGALKELSHPRALKWAERVEQSLYDAADRIVVTTRAFERHIAARRPQRLEKIVYVPNGTVGDVFDPARGDAGIRSRLARQGEFVVMYAGLHGVAQGLSTALDAAARLRGRSIRFVFLGEGPLKRALQQQASALALDNVIFVDQVPLESSAHYLNAADALLVPLLPDPVFDMFVPSKLFDALSAAKPVLLAVGGEAREILERSGGGVFVPPGDAAALASAILALQANPGACAEMGRAGRRFVRQHFLRSEQARTFVSVLEETAANRHGASEVPVRAVR
jgi:glycosyltransferase involved in cell wall biosynthesis